MEKRTLTVHHSRTLFDWGIGLMEKALTLPGPKRRPVMLRDGLMIATLALAGPRLGSVLEMEVGRYLRFNGGEWWLAFNEPDMKNGRPLDCPLHRSLSPWIQRYIEVERRELLGGHMTDAVWVNWSGQPLGAAGIEKRIRWWSAKRFGEKEAFGPHRFRHCLATTAARVTPEAPGIGAAILNITGKVFHEHYDRSQRITAAGRFLSTLDQDREEAREYSRRHADDRRSDDHADSDRQPRAGTRR
ncbi:hypothetical protein GCM10011504_56980 [Siccirubricoccus deserti]|uniref:Tyrosine-type recombinase/integrase n=1 Tax=Siccirubricoccus deserti TaxID=2013562 RepID=A0A9X0R5B0_9PROT|nr:tyrosine-type recombinase/integrase [Siccirubricoccus deserti]MBC4019208.1 tyrosine-type recombinase/integrase [Siccirubricoccus deserti]GGC71969.1 hypothetical protein GCM10011504_56980 [Siccirubricoccus deserti]